MALMFCSLRGSVELLRTQGKGERCVPETLGKELVKEIYPTVNHILENNVNEVDLNDVETIMNQEANMVSDPVDPMSNVSLLYDMMQELIRHESWN